MTGMALSPEGVAVARCIRHGNEAPRLALCEFRALERNLHGVPPPGLVRELQLDSSRCTSVIKQGDFTLLMVEAPQVDPTELRAAIRWRVKDLLDFHVDDAVLDVFDIPGQQERGRPRLMYVVAARITAVRQHIDTLEGNGVQLSVIDIPELCQRNVAALLPEDSGGVAMLHFGHDGGLLTLTRGGTLYLSRNLELGSAHLLAASQEDQELTTELARMLDGVVLEVQRSLDYYESHFSLPPVSGLVIAPTERPVPGLLAHLAGNLGVPVRMLDLNAVLDTEQTLSDSLQAACLPAIGAALRHEEKAL